MQDADTVLSIYQERGKKGLPLDGVYRMLYKRELYLRAYARLYSNDGAMTKGSTEETVDEMSQAKIDHLITLVRERKFRWTPVRRVHIPKKSYHSGKLERLVKKRKKAVEYRHGRA